MSQLPKSKSAQLADLLRERLASGVWGSKLPSERVLAGEFLVSRTTLREALAALTKEKRIEPATTTRGARSIINKSTAATHAKYGQVCILTPTLQGSPLLIEQLGFMREMLGRAGLIAYVEECAALSERPDPSSNLRRVIERHPKSIWVLHKMPVSVQRWFEASGLPAVVFGSVFPGISLPGVDVDFRAAAHHAAGICLARGCKRITLLVHRTALAGDTRTVDAISEELARRGEAPPHIMRYDFNRMRLMDGLDREIVAKPDACDALIIASHHHLLTTLSHLLRRGVRIPEDLSLVYLSNDPSVERLSPLPFRYDPGPGLIRRLVSAIKTLAEGGSPKSCLLIPKLLEGESLRPPVLTGSKKNQKA